MELNELFESTWYTYKDGKYRVLGVCKLKNINGDWVIGVQYKSVENKPSIDYGDGWDLKGPLYVRCYNDFIKKFKAV